MSTQNIPPTGTGPSRTLNDQMELLKFLREEAEANRQRLNDEAEADRALLKHILWLVSIPLSIALVAAGWIGISSVTSLKQAIQEQAQTEGKRAISQAMDQLQTELRDKVSDQFQTPKIKDTIHGAAIEATKNEANGMIRDAVKTQVATAVAAQSGQIQKVAIQAVNEKVEGAIAPLADQAKVSLSALHVQQLIAEADSDNANAIDELIGLRSGGSPNQQALITGVIADRRRYEHDSGVRGGGGNYRRCLDPQSPDFSSKLRSPDVRIRQEALADCAAWSGSELDRPVLSSPNGDVTYSPVRIEEELVPILVNTALSDSSILVRAQAINSLNTFFESSPGYPRDGLDLIETSGLKRWWQAHRSDYEALEWVARTDWHRRPSALDSVYFYDQLTKVKTTSTPASEAIQNILLAMRRQASGPSEESPSRLKTRLGRDSCESVKADLALRLSDWTKQQAYLQLSEDYGIYEIAFLKSCPADPQYLHEVANYASSSPSLSRRYGSVVAINTWQGTHFDPLDTTEFQKWWTNQKAVSQK